MLVVFGVMGFSSWLRAESQPTPLSFFADGAFALSSFDSKAVTMIGAAGGVLLYQELALGLAGEHMLSRPIVSVGQTPYKVGMWYVGGVMGHYIPLTERIDLFLAARGGIGQIAKTDAPSDPDRILILEPQLQGLYSVTSSLHVGLGVGYRFVQFAQEMRNSAAGGSFADLELVGK